MSTPSSPGWYDDPEDAARLRYFDGVVWTQHTTPKSTRPATTAEQAAAAGAEAARQWVSPGGHGSHPGAPGGGPRSAAGPQAGVPGGQGRGPGTQPGRPNPQFPGAPQQHQWNAPPVGQGWATGPTTPDGQPLASYWQRVGAYLIDAILTGLVSALLGGWMLYRAMQPFFDGFGDAVRSGDAATMERITSDIDYGYLAGFSLVAAVVAFAYQVFFLTRSGATPGKSVAGISVRLRERPGPLTLASAARRASVQTLLGLLGNVPLLGTFASIAALLDLLWPAWDSHRQAWHDKVAATNVVVGRQPRG
ncbi:hypothetical protein GCM10027517_04430 [Phycicoccus ginsengisoli]